MGTRLGLAALEAVADRFSRSVTVVPEEEGSVTPITRYRRRVRGGAEAPALAAASETVSIPLMPHPPLEEIERQRREYDEALEEARASGDRGKVKLAYYHGVLGAPGRGAAPRRHRSDGGARAGARGADRGRRHRDGAGGDVHRVRDRGQGALARRADALRRVHERDPRLPADRERVPVRRLRGGLRLQERRACRRCSIRASSGSSSRPASGSRSGCSRRRSRGNRPHGWVARGEVPRLPETPLEHPSRPVAEAAT